MTLSISKLHPLFGAEVGGVDASRDDRDTTAAIGEAIGRFGLLLFRGMSMDDDALEQFAARFGALQNMSGKADTRRHIIRVSNLDEHGAIKPASEMSRLQHEANKLWHTDSSFLSPGASYSFLHAHIVTSEGGKTQFCDTRVAWEALPPERQRQLAGLHADHSMMHSWRLTGVDMSAVVAAPMPAVRRDLVRSHQPSGRRALMVPSHVERVEGLDASETLALVADLIALAASPDRVYTHEWQPGDLLIWDNRCMLHRVTPYRGEQEPRDLRSCRVVDRDDESSVVRGAA